MTQPPVPDCDIHKISVMIDLLREVLLSSNLPLSDNEVVNTAFGVYSTIMVDVIKGLMTTGKEDMASKLRDNSMEQCQRYCNLLLELCPRRMVELN